MKRGLAPAVNELIRGLMTSDVAEAAAEIRQNLENQENIRLNIAVTGETGSGKSTFVNAFRGINNDDRRAAPIGVIENIRYPNPYRHPDIPNVILWDLPGIGTPTYPRNSYFDRTGFRKFDFFIIISSARLTENDVMLAKEIKRIGKRFYFVHSKVDRDLEDERNRRNVNAERTLERLREQRVQDLRRHGFEDTQIFLMCNFERHQYEFPLLYQTFIRELPGLKGRALRMAMLDIFMEVLERKKEAFASEIKMYVGLSAAGAAVPIPGLSAAIDLSLIFKVVKEYVAGFGLNPSSLRKLADNTGVPFDELTVNIRSLLANREITPELIVTLLTQCASIAGLLAAEEWTRFIPLVGIPFAMGLSSLTTHRALNFFLDELVGEAKRVFRTALRFNTL